MPLIKTLVCTDPSVKIEGYICNTCFATNRDGVGDGTSFQISDSEAVGTHPQPFYTTTHALLLTPPAQAYYNNTGDCMEL